MVAAIIRTSRDIWSITRVGIRTTTITTAIPIIRITRTFQSTTRTIWTTTTTIRTTFHTGYPEQTMFRRRKTQTVCKSTPIQTSTLHNGRRCQTQRSTKDRAMRNRCICFAKTENRHASPTLRFQLQRDQCSQLTASTTDADKLLFSKINNCICFCAHLADAARSKSRERYLKHFSRTYEC